MTKDELLALAKRVESCGVSDNSLDVLVEVALFKPDSIYSNCAANTAGTKVIYTRLDGGRSTHWAHDYTIDGPSRALAARRLRDKAKTAPE